MLGISLNGAIPKWLIYHGKSHEKMDDDWGYISGNGHMEHKI